MLWSKGRHLLSGSDEAYYRVEPLRCRARFLVCGVYRRRAFSCRCRILFFGVYMIVFSLAFFVVHACFATVFEVPRDLEFLGVEFGNKFFEMAEPASVNLKKCVIKKGSFTDILNLQDIKGTEISCFVVNGRIDPDDWIFCLSRDGGDTSRVSGVVWFLRGETVQQMLCQVEYGAQKDSYKIDSFVDCFDPQKRRYEIGKESLTLRRFLGSCTDGREVFVSVTVSYSCLQKVVVRCGRCGDGEVLDAGEYIGTLLLNTREEATLPKKSDNGVFAP